jgi:alpha-D-xyloside xylohydrolase
MLAAGWAEAGGTDTAVAAVAVVAGKPNIETSADGIVVAWGGDYLKLQVRADNIIRVAYAKDRAFFERGSIDVLPLGNVPKWTLAESGVSRAPRDEADRPAVGGGAGGDAARPPHTVTVSTKRVSARVDLATGAVTFLDPAGRPVLAEKAGGRSLEAATVMGESTYRVRQQWLGHDDESLYGLGQMQMGMVDVKGYDLDLWQRNTVIVVPCLVSSRGYGILWDNTSYTRFGDLRDFVPIPGVPGFESPQGGGGTVADFGLHAPTHDVTSVVAPVSGDYQIRAYYNGGLKLWLDGKLLVDHWRQDWLPETDQVRVRLVAGRRYSMVTETDGERSNVMRLTWKPPLPTVGAGRPAVTSLWSNVGDGIDYYFVLGPSLDGVEAGFRTLTGRAAMLPRWAFGLWQSRDHYQTQAQLLGALDGFRSRHIPLDNMVQDWQYWVTEPVNQWGSHGFDPQRFPDPAGMIEAVHRAHAHLMISIWGKFYEGTEHFDALNRGGYLFQPTLKEGLVRDGRHYAFVDPFQAGGREMFWSQVRDSLFSKGVDAWWMDATEPETVSPPDQQSYAAHMNPTGLGSGARMQNGYALMMARALYEGQRAAAPEQRVFVLTRSGFIGEQRYGALSWSGDVTSTWSALRKQITAGLGFSISGVPFWTTDTGGYLMQKRYAVDPTPEDKASWLELNSRWFQFSTFCPILRVHGQQQLREMYNLGDERSEIYRSELKFDRLRYALLPYVYSLAGAATQDGGTLMRPLVMDFPGDRVGRELTDEYLFGPAFLVAPVTTFGARSRGVYLPAGADWYDFWTGARLHGGRTVEAPAPFDSLPVYVRAGSIVPFGPSLEYTSEKPADPITLRVYTGADASFSLYEDDGLSYGYERGEFSRIEIRWDEARRTLTIERRSGAFPGMLPARTFNVVLISPARPSGYADTSAPTSVTYDGSKVVLRLGTMARMRDRAAPVGAL